MPTDRLVQLDTNIDDLDPRLLPRVIDQLLDAGALDAWITPIVMKKGRPAFTVSALADPTVVDSVRAVLFAETSTLGIRQHELTRHSLDRRVVTVEVDGHQIGVKLAVDGERVLNVSVEWDDVAAAADSTGRPAIDVLAAADTAARRGV